MVMSGGCGGGNVDHSYGQKLSVFIISVSHISQLVDVRVVGAEMIFSSLQSKLHCTRFHQFIEVEHEQNLITVAVATAIVFTSKHTTTFSPRQGWKRLERYEYGGNDERSEFGSRDRMN